MTITVRLFGVEVLHVSTDSADDEPEQRDTDSTGYFVGFAIPDNLAGNPPREPYRHQDPW